MTTHRIAGALSAVVCACLSLSPAFAADKQDFERQVESQVKQLSLKAKTELKGVGEKTNRTSAAGGGTHGLGFINKKLANADYRRFGGKGATVPDKLDLRPGLTQIEDQGSCGSCWAFSLTATHRDGHAIAGKDPGRLSQEWLVDNSPEAKGCSGGYFDSANDFIKPKGQPLWDDCPYAQGSGKCAADLRPAAHITAWHMIGTEKGATAQDIEAYMASSGKPVSISVAAATGNWMSYPGGVFNDCQMGDEDHMINIVGWDNEGAVFDANGSLPPGKGIWILRNSWGKSWGEGGYMRSKMTDSKGQRCNAVATQAAYFDFDD